MSPYSFISCASFYAFIWICVEEKNRSNLFYIPMLLVFDLKTIKLLWEQNCNLTKWISHSTGVKGNLHLANISSFGHISCLAPSFFMLRLSCVKKFRQVWVSKLFVSEQKRLHLSCFMAEAYLLEEGSDWAKMGYPSPVRLPQISVTLSFIRVYRNCKIFVVSFLTLQASSFMCYKRQ